MKSQITGTRELLPQQMQFSNLCYGQAIIFTNYIPLLQASLLSNISEIPLNFEKD
jgi:hypothetical protein